MGFEGAALGSSASQVLRAAALLLYIASAGGSWSRRCWGGFSRDALRGWGLMVRSSFAGSVATLSEYAAFEILCFSTSYLSTQHLAAQSILTTTSIVVWHVPFSISVFSSNRVGHLVGAGLVGAARRAAVFQTRQPQDIPTPVPPPFLPGNPPPVVLPTTWPRFEIFARPIPLQNGFYELVYVQVPEMIVLGITPIESGDRLRPAFVKAWERSNEIMRGRYGNHLPIWMRPKSRWQRILEMVPYGAKTEVMINLFALAAIGLAIVGIFVVWEARNLSGIQTCKKFC
ncbi:putative transporter [Colletotrichum siamense]|uniref:Transporter n=1 Tax=Colletotrichum siamense TaxID=690259 RepID=A0A9P5F3Q1_COLSI|nr:putative transporter [Colletotrichum siamense]KAF4867180.1 putative transporter [Colletotrichum siamense]